MKIGFIGLGNVGGKLAGSLLRNKFNLTVLDLDASLVKDFVSKGSISAKSPKELAEKVDLIITCLPSPKICAEVMEKKDGVIEGLSKEKIWLEMSTTDDKEVKRIGELVKSKGAIPLDAPVSGGVEGAKTRDLTLLVGGDLSILNNARPVLDAMGKTVLHVGAVGSGNICKLMHNCANFSLSLATIQCLNVAVKAGLDPSVVIEVFQKSALGKNFDLQVRLPETLFKGDFEPRFSLKLANKDLNLAIELAASLGMDFSMAETCQIDMLKAVEKGWSDMDSSIFLTLQEEKSGVLLRHNNNQK